MKCTLFSYSGKPAHPDNFIPDSGLAVLAACLKDKGHECAIYDLNTPKLFGELSARKKLYSHILNIVKEEQPDLIGFKVYLNGFYDTVAAANNIKKRFPEIPIVLGGPNATYFEEHLLSEIGNCDAIISGEAEKSIVALADAVESRKSIEQVPGIILKRKDGRVVKNQRDIVTRLDKIPLPDWSSYSQLEQHWPIIPVSMVRGCVYKCAFCAHPHIWGDKIRKRTIENVVSDIKSTYENYGITHYRITDSTPLPNMLESFSNKVLDEGMDITWTTFGHFNIIKKDLLKLMKDAGCLLVWYGLESGNNEILERMGKRFTTQDVEKATAAARDAGLPYGVSIMIGFPGETGATIDKTVDFVKKLNPDFVQITPLGVLPNTPLSEEPEKYGISLGKNWQKHLMRAKFEGMSKQIVKSGTSYYRSSGKPWSYWIQKTGEVAEQLEKEGILTQTVDDLFLMADLVEMPIREFRAKIKTLFNHADQTGLEELISKAWKTKKPIRQAGKNLLWIP